MAGARGLKTSDPYSVKVHNECDQASFRTIKDEVMTLKTMQFGTSGTISGTTRVASPLMTRRGGFTGCMNALTRFVFPVTLDIVDVGPVLDEDAVSLEPLWGNRS